MQEEDKKYPFIVVARLREVGSIKEIQVEVFDPEDPSLNPYPIADGCAPAYGEDGLATAVYRAFAELEIPPKEILKKELDDLIREIEEDTNV